MEIQPIPFSFHYPVPHFTGGPVQALTLTIDGSAHCKLVAGAIGDDLAYSATLSLVQFGGANLLPLLQAKCPDLLAEIQGAADAHAAYVFQQPSAASTLDPAQCFRAGSGSFAATLLNEIEEGKGLDAIKAICSEVVQLTQDTGYWKTKAA